MHPEIAPVPGIGNQVPSDLLPEGVAVCYFNSHAFMEQVVAPSFAAEANEEARAKSRSKGRAKSDAADTRPLITAQWRDDNPEELARLMSRPNECPVCSHSFASDPTIVWTGPLNTIDMPTRCTHMACAHARAAGTRSANATVAARSVATTCPIGRCRATETRSSATCQRQPSPSFPSAFRPGSATNCATAPPM